MNFKVAFSRIAKVYLPGPVAAGHTNQKIALLLFSKIQKHGQKFGNCRVPCKGKDH